MSQRPCRGDSEWMYLLSNRKLHIEYRWDTVVSNILKNLDTWTTSECNLGFTWDNPKFQVFSRTTRLCPNILERLLQYPSE